MTPTSIDSEFGYDTAGHDPYHYRFLPALRSLMRELAVQKEMRIFEIGCVNGSIANELAQHGYKIIGIDTSEQAVATGSAAYPQLKLHVGSVYSDLRAEYGTFPVVMSLEVIEHLVDPFLFCCRVYDLLEPGGVAVVSTPYHGYLKNLMLSVFDHWDVHLHTLKQPGWHIKFFSIKTLTQILEEAGLKVERLIRFGRPIPWIATGMIAVARKPLDPAPEGATAARR